MHKRARRVVAGVGCRVAQAQLENSPCHGDADCGSGYTCERTLEQREEPDEPLVENRVVDVGACRPEGEATCEPGQQDGCRTDTSADGCSADEDLFEVCNEKDARCFCCAPQSDASGFTPFAYLVDDDGSNAACTECPIDCATGVACTRASHDECTVPSGSICGCTP